LTVGTPPPLGIGSNGLPRRRSHGTKWRTQRLVVRHASPRVGCVGAAVGAHFTSAHLRPTALPRVIIDRDSNVVRPSDNTGRFLRNAGGELTSDIMTLVLPELRRELHTADL